MGLHFRGYLRGGMRLPRAWIDRPIKVNTIAYERAAFKAAGLPHPDDVADSRTFHHILGHMLPADIEDMVSRLSKRRRREVREQLWLAANEKDWQGADLDALPFVPAIMDDGNARDMLLGALRASYEALTFEDYLCNFRPGHPKQHKRQHKTIRKNDTDKDQQVDKTTWTVMDPEDARWVALTKSELGDRLTPDLAGYLAYLNAVAPGFGAFLKRPLPVLMPEGARQKHTYVSGATGCGKTEVLKLLVQSTAAWGKGAVVVIDPHGTMAQQIARWPDWSDSDRLVYIDPFLDAGHTPVFNPFHAPKGADLHGLTQQLVAALQDMLKDQEGGALTVNMSTILEHCVLALFHMDKASLPDLLTFMNDRENAGLIAKAKAVLPPFEARFFEGEFQQREFDVTKKSITNKLRRILSGAHRMFTGGTTVPLDKLIRQRKVIIVNLSRGRLGADASEALGRFLMASLQAMALRREAEPEKRHVPVHVFLDECQNYIGRSTVGILEEARKYRVFLTLAQQTVGRGMATDIRDTVLSNTGMKIAGRNSRDSHNLIARAANIPAETMTELKDRQFLLKTGDKPPLILRPASHLADGSHGISDDAWNARKADQLKRYYRKATKPPPGQGKGGDKPTQPQSGDERKPKYDFESAGSGFESSRDRQFNYIYQYVIKNLFHKLSSRKPAGSNTEATAQAIWC